MFNKPISRLMRILQGERLETDDPALLERGFTKLETFVHFWVLVWRSFVRNRCPVRASSLSYVTMLALIPMLAVAMSVTSIFPEGRQEINHFIERFAEAMIPDVGVGTNMYGPFLPAELLAESASTNSPSESTTNQNPVISAGAALEQPPTGNPDTAAARKRAADYIRGFVEKTYSGTLGVTGVIALFITAILTLTRIEEAFNDIWGVTRGRNWLARIVLYWTTITLGPLVLAAAVVLASGPHFQKTHDLLSFMPMFEPFISRVLPVILICVCFSLFYKLVPNTKIDFSAAFVGGTLAGVSWHFYNTLGFVLASKAVSASKIYGSLALLPLLMGGLYVVWLTVLFGAQVAYAFQNRALYLQEKLVENVNQRGREFVALRLMTALGQRYLLGEPPPTVPQISKELGIPSRLVQQVMQTLIAARLVNEVSGTEHTYAPARPLEAINCHHILLAMRATQGQELITRDEPVREEVYGEFARIQAAEKE
ncbi:MAG: YihY family inner membrane protein, partial [Verrucomicrobia bacterium]